MTDNELLLAISNIMDKKLMPIEARLDRLEKRMERLEERMDRLEERMSYMEEQMNCLKEQMNRLEERVKHDELITENEIRPMLKILTENYMPAAVRFEKVSNRLDAMEADIAVIKSVVTEHSQRFLSMA